MTRKMAQIGGANVVWDAEDDGNAGSTAQPACGLWGTPPSAIVYPFHSSSVGVDGPPTASSVPE